MSTTAKPAKAPPPASPPPPAEESPAPGPAGPQIHRAIVSILSEIGPISKDRNVDKQAGGWAYRGIDDVFNAVHPLLAKHRVYPTSRIDNVHREERQTRSGSMLMYTLLTMTYRFTCDDGSFVETQVIGEGMDSGDKSANKAMSVAFKYAIFQMLAVPVAMVDPDDDVPPEVKSRDAQAAADNSPVPRSQELRQPVSVQQMDIKAMESRIDEAALAVDPLKKLVQEINQAAINTLVPAHEATKLRVRATRRLVEVAPELAIKWIEAYEARGMMGVDDVKAIRTRAEEIIKDQENNLG